MAQQELPGQLVPLVLVLLEPLAPLALTVQQV